MRSGKISAGIRYSVLVVGFAIENRKSRYLIFSAQYPIPTTQYLIYLQILLKKLPGIGNIARSFSVFGRLGAFPKGYKNGFF